MAANGNNSAYAIGARGPFAQEGMLGKVDDVGVFSIALTAAEVAAIYNLALEPGLHYELGEANSLLEAFADGDTQVIVDGKTWYRVANLGGTNGQVFALGGGNFAINVLNGVGFSTATPEPTALVLTSIVGAVAIVAGCQLRRRKKLIASV